MTPAQADALARAEAALADLRRLLSDNPPAPPVASPGAVGAASRKLTTQDISDAATVLAVDAKKVWAVAKVESGPLGGFAPDGRPIILFEPHVFSRLTQHRFDAGHGGVSYPKWGAKPYPKTQAERWGQLDYAANLDHDAALQSASYGLFQIMGFNFKICGFQTILEFWDAMHRTERDHLLAFAAFVKGNNLDAPLRAGDWAAFARGYNGPGQAEAYALKLATTYAQA